MVFKIWKVSIFLNLDYRDFFVQFLFPEFIQIPLMLFDYRDSNFFSWRSFDNRLATVVIRNATKK